MSRTKGSKNKPKVKKYRKQRGNFMADVNDVLKAIESLSQAIDTLISGLGKGPDTQPAVDAINALTAKIQSIQLSA